MSGIPPSSDPRVLVDFRTADDAGVYAWEGGPALVQTVDFFTPIVDDPFLYGQIAAANALSDVYAMGGEPRTALAIAAFPQDGLDTESIAAIFRGGYENIDHAAIWSGDHNHACEGPDTQREVSAADLANLFWWCAPRGPTSCA